MKAVGEAARARAIAKLAIAIAGEHRTSLVTTGEADRATAAVDAITEHVVETVRDLLSAESSVRRG